MKQGCSDQEARNSANVHTRQVQAGHRSHNPVLYSRSGTHLFDYIHLANNVFTGDLRV